jgi:hypothetical protein
MDNQQERPLTEKELEVRKKEMLKFYQDSMPYVKAQLEYEEMLFKIDEVRFKRTSIQVQLAMMMTEAKSQEEKPFGTESEEETPEEVSERIKSKTP